MGRKLKLIKFIKQSYKYNNTFIYKKGRVFLSYFDGERMPDKKYVIKMFIKYNGDRLLPTLTINGETSKFYESCWVHICTARLKDGTRMWNRF